MPEDETQEVPLPEGTIPDQESVTTQEIPLAKDAFPKIQLVSPVKVDLPPVHLLNDPIMTMDAPVADDTPLYDQLNPRVQPPAPARERRRMRMGDKVLVGMGVLAVGMTVMLYGMVVYGWGSGPVPRNEAKPRHTAVTTERPVAPDVLPTLGPPTSRPPVEEVKAAVAPSTHRAEPSPTRTAAPSPMKTVSAPETPVETTSAPEPSPRPTRASTPPPSPTQTEESPTPTPTESSASPTGTITPTASSTEE